MICITKIKLYEKIVNLIDDHNRIEIMCYCKHDISDNLNSFFFQKYYEKTYLQRVNFKNIQRFF